jgi:hypothetical protein
MSLRKNGWVGNYSASAADGLAYASFAMTTVCSGHTVLHNTCLTATDRGFTWPIVYSSLNR